ncbi:hypothetical protein B0T09DRAFT_340225 [Sordaria sp. MPI-SDFR-AT-0083]|nr:hypothetical protein B0T09DRAFT_340225 [Sordaria sp. MPI-SDFR-AT-0083]
MNQGPHQHFDCLRFNMTQSPDFVGPTYPPLEQFEDLLDTMDALSFVQNFSIYLNMSSIPPEILRPISSFPSLFSPTNFCRRLKTDARRANLRSLYCGQGGQRINSGATTKILSTAPCTVNPGHGTAQDASSIPIKAASDGLQSPAQFSTPSGTSPKPYLSIHF